MEKKEDKLPPRGKTAKKTVKKPAKKKQTKAVVPVTQEVGLVPINLNSLMTAAIKKGKEGIEMLERLMALKERMEKEEARKAYFDALARFQRECPIIPKTKTVFNKDGTTIRYRYAPTEVIVEHIKEPLSRCGLSYTLDLKQEERSVTGIFVGHHVDGHEEHTAITVPVMSSEYMNAAQSVISARTYATRIAICNGLGIATADEDDDGNATGPGGGQVEPPKARGGKKSSRAAQPPPSKVEDSPTEKTERDVTPPPEEKKKPGLTLQQIKERCLTGLTMLLKEGAIGQDQNDTILAGIDELVARGDYSNLLTNYKEIREMWDAWQKKGGETNG